LPWQPFLAFYIWGAHWRHLKNTTEPSMCGGDAALCQITLTTCYVAYTDRAAWSVCRSVTIASPAKTAEPIKMPFLMKTHVWTQGTVCWMGVQIPSYKGGNFGGRAQHVPGHIRRSKYSKWLGRGQHRYGADADWDVLDGVHVGATWRIQLNCPRASANYFEHFAAFYRIMSECRSPFHDCLTGRYTIKHRVVCDQKKCAM